MRPKDIPGAPGRVDAADGLAADRDDLADRLHRLPPGHPSAASDGAGGRADQAADGGEGESPERDDDLDPDHDPGGAGAASAEPEARAGDRHAASTRPPGALGSGEPYRPWFAGTEPADPWFWADGG
jgi:hypothetical protein